MVDVLAVPHGLEDPVREPQDEDVLDGLLAEVVVDAEDLILAEDGVHDLRELHRGRKVPAERLLDDDPRPTRLAPEAMRADGLDDRRIGRRRRREVEEPVRVRAELSVDVVEPPPQVVVRRLVRRRDEVDVLGEALPDLFVQRLRPRMPRDRVAELRAEAVVGHRLARRADDGERGREETLEREVVQGGKELALREVAGAAEDDDRRGLGRTSEAQPLAERVDDRGRQDALPLTDLGASRRRRAHGWSTRSSGQSPSSLGLHSFLTAWPPNWLRSAAATFIA